MKSNWLNAAVCRLRALAATGLLALLAVLGTLPARAQTAAAAVTDDVPEMADALRQSGKIYVVVLVILLILGGLLTYLIRLDRKVAQLERELREGA